MDTTVLAARAALEEAQGLSRANRLDAALEVLARIAAGTVEWPTAQFLRAGILNQLGRIEEAVGAVGEAIRVGGEQVGFVGLQGNLRMRARQSDQAEAPLRLAVAMSTDNVWVYINLGYLLSSRQQPGAAVDVIRQGLMVCPEDPYLVAHLGRFLHAASRLEEADAVMADAAGRFAGVAEVHLFRSELQRARGDLGGAADSLHKALALRPHQAKWKRDLEQLTEEARHHAAPRAPIPCEAVRLVIWDLDDTFWRGTVTEGGIREYVQAHHDAVIELARRGIMSSICSKNDADVIRRILEERKILEYFIFPSISWEAKGARIAALIEAVQLRPVTVMFIDDNPINRAEAAAVVADLQVEDERFLARMLEDPRFKGKDDSQLTRLAQYKLLERRKQDEVKLSSGGSNEAFLRGCDVRVHIEYDVLANLDRAIELINRTNQLNYTKRRLPEDPEQAREALSNEIRPFHRQSGLVRVTDRYGDYGYVGLFVTQTARAAKIAGRADLKALHFCFSCRTLGMLVEQWVYQHLGRPELTVVGEVLTDLSIERNIDWIRLGSGDADSAVERNWVAPEIRVLGGCEANSLGIYLNANSPKVTVRGNFAANGMFYRINGGELAASLTDRMGAEFADEAARLGIPDHLAAFDLFGGAPEGAAFVINCSKDGRAGFHQFRHRQRGWVVSVEPTPRPFLNLGTTEPGELSRQLEEIFQTDMETRRRVEAVSHHLREAYRAETDFPSARRVEAAVRELIGRVPAGCKLVFALDHHLERTPDGVLRESPSVIDANDCICRVIQEFPFAGTVAFSESILSTDEIQPGGNHYDRAVYLRVAQAIASRIAELPSRSGS